MGNCMGLTLWFRAIPSPRGLDGSDDGLPALMDVHMLHSDLLLSFSAMAVQRL
jgi:hypothetical protein